MHRSNRRQFVAGLGGGVFLCGLGVGLTRESARAAGALGAPWLEGPDALDLGRYAALADRMTVTPTDDLQPWLVRAMREGTSFRELVAAAALANARAFGGTHYDGYHAAMALMPVLGMAEELPQRRAALAVLKVLYRNTSFIHEAGRAERPSLAAVDADDEASAEGLLAAQRARDLARSERQLARLVERDGAKGAFEAMQPLVRDDNDVHRVVLAWRAYDLAELAGAEFAGVLLRQSVRHCVDAEKSETPPIRRDLPRIFDATGVLAKSPAERALGDEELAELAVVVVCCSQAEAAEAVARALASGAKPHDVGEAISLAATRLVLYDPGRGKDASHGRTRGSVHGASLGVHGCDAAAAWRGIAGIVGPREARAALVAAAYHTGGSSRQLTKERIDCGEASETAKRTEPRALLDLFRGAVERRDQALASAAIDRWVGEGQDVEAFLAVARDGAVDDDGALHAEKFYRTQSVELRRCRPAFRAEHAIALARVTASQHGAAVPGREQAEELLG